MRLVDESGIYQKLNFEPIIEHDGDSYARCKVRIGELLQAIELIEKLVEIIPDGPISVPAKGNVEGEYVFRIEQPRGEGIFYAKGNGTKFLDRMRVRTPTNTNIPALLKMLQGCDLADVPMLILAIDPCISCTER